MLFIWGKYVKFEMCCLQCRARRQVACREPCCAKFGSRIKYIRIPRKLIGYSEISGDFPDLLNQNPKSFESTPKFENPWITSEKILPVIPTAIIPGCLPLALCFYSLIVMERLLKWSCSVWGGCSVKERRQAGSFDLSPVLWHGESYLRFLSLHFCFCKMRSTHIINSITVSRETK